MTYYFPHSSRVAAGRYAETISATMAEPATRLAENPGRETLAASIAEAAIAGAPPRIMSGLIVAADADILQ